jgi:high frequency lysogenization protein
MKSNPRNLAIALAGIFQAVRLVQQIARGRERDATAFNACIHGLFNTDPESAENVFGELRGIRSGLETLHAQISGAKTSRDVELTRYAISVLYLERKLNKDTTRLETIRAAINLTREQADLPGLGHPGVITSLAECYKQTVSTLHPRIIVNGEPAILGATENQNLIRVLLLAAIRAAVLWRQCGGGRLTLLIRRKALLHSTRLLLEELRI